MISMEQWYKEQYIIFLVIGLVIVLVEFTVLLSTILACTKLYKHKQQAKEKTENETVAKVPKVAENIYQRKVPFDNSYTLSNSFRQNYKLIDKA